MGKIKIILMGTSGFAIPSFENLIKDNDFEISAIFTSPDKPSNRGCNVSESPVSKFIKAIGYKGDVYKPNSLKTDDVFNLISGLNPDLIYVVSYGYILPERILEIPRLGCINLHASLLPLHRGPSPIQQAILKGDNKSGVTFFKLTKGVDDGPVIWREEVPLTGEETFESLHDYLSDFGSKLVSNVLKKYINGEIMPIAQDHSMATKCKIIDKSDGYIDWGFESAEDIERKVRAYCPWPGTFTKFNNKILKILKAKLSDKKSHVLPGTVFKDEDKYLVRTRNKSLELIEVQLEGKKRTDIKEFINGYNDFIGTKLG